MPPTFPDWLASDASAQALEQIPTLLYTEPFEMDDDGKIKIPRMEIHCRYTDDMGNPCGKKLGQHGALATHVKSHGKNIEIAVNQPSPGKKGTGGPVPNSEKGPIKRNLANLVADHEALVAGSLNLPTPDATKPKTGAVKKLPAKAPITLPLELIFTPGDEDLDFKAMIAEAKSLGLWRDTACPPCTGPGRRTRKTPKECTLKKGCLTRDELWADFSGFAD